MKLVENGSETKSRIFWIELSMHLLQNDDKPEALPVSLSKKFILKRSF